MYSYLENYKQLKETQQTKEIKQIVLPAEYWQSHLTIDFPAHKETSHPKIFHLPKREKKKPIKINNWAIQQGDYRVREKYKDMTYYRELKIKVLKALVFIAILVSGISVYYVSSFIARF